MLGGGGEAKPFYVGIGMSRQVKWVTAQVPEECTDDKLDCCAARVRERKLKEKKHKLRWSVEGSKKEKKSDDVTSSLILLIFHSVCCCAVLFFFFVFSTFYKVDS